jgi:hypothetical protein
LNARRVGAAAFPEPREAGSLRSGFANAFTSNISNTASLAIQMAAKRLQDATFAKQAEMARSLQSGVDITA